ncbi:MAG: glycosyltransferase [Candidatus Woesearchaeota archaeon]
MKIVVIIPTYNERENIATALQGVLAHKNLHVLVVDDNSPDKTADVVKQFMKQSKRISLLSGEKQGLGAAYIRGFKHAIETLEADVVIEMDADGSHDTKDLPRLLTPILAGEADFVIGSRYVQGGRVEGWNWYRYLVSYVGNFFSRVIGGILSVKDTTAGFRAIKKEVITSIDWDAFASQGYSFQIRLLHEALSKNFRVQEVPVTFIDRKIGESKLGRKDIAEFMSTSIVLGWRTYKRLIIFLLVGLSGIIVNIGAQSILLRGVGIGSYASLGLAIEASILWNFLFHDKITFADRRTGNWFSRLLKYHVTSAGGAIINFFVAGTLIHADVFFDEAANLFGILIATAWNFFLSYFWAWKK